MNLSLFSDYSLRVMMFAALKNGQFQIEEVSAAYQINPHHLAKVIYKLSKLGYLETRRGRGGGSRLAREPDAVRIGTLLRATEKNTALVECFDPANNRCRIAGACRLQPMLAEAAQSFFESLDRYTLQDLVAQPQRDKMRQILSATAESASLKS